MEFRKMVMITLYARKQKRHRCIKQCFGLCGRGRGMIWENGIEACILSYVKRITRFDAWYRMLRDGALGWPRGILWGGKWEGSSGWGKKEKNTSDKMTLIPFSFSCVIVPVWFCNWDHLIPSGEGSYLVLPLPYWFITKPFISISNHFSQNSSFWVRKSYLICWTASSSNIKGQWT